MLVTSLIVGLSGLTTITPVGQEIASAKTYDMSANLANHLKKGTFPGLNSKVGDRDSVVEKRNPRATWWKGDMHIFLDLPNEQYSSTSYLFVKQSSCVLQ